MAHLCITLSENSLLYQVITSILVPKREHPPQTKLFHQTYQVGSCTPYFKPFEEMAIKLWYTFHNPQTFSWDEFALMHTKHKEKTRTNTACKESANSRTESSSESRAAIAQARRRAALCRLWRDTTRDPLQWRALRHWASCLPCRCCGHSALIPLASPVHRRLWHPPQVQPAND